MDGAEVALAALGILATLAGGLVWVVKTLMTKTDKTMTKLATAIEKSSESSDALKASIDRRADEDAKWQAQTADWQRQTASILNAVAEKVSILPKISEKQDVIYDTISATNMTVQNMTVNHEIVKQKARKK